MKVNGNVILIEKKMSLQEFLVSYQYDITKIAVERNGDIIQKSNYENIILSELDTLEIVSFVGGG